MMSASVKSISKTFLAALLTLALMLCLNPVAYAEELSDGSESLQKQTSKDTKSESQNESPSDVAAEGEGAANNASTENALNNVEDGVANLDSLSLNQGITYETDSLDDDSAVDSGLLAGEQDESEAKGEAENQEEKIVSLEASAHVQTYGWLDATSAEVGQSLVIGTTGQFKRLEAIKLNVGVVGFEEGCTGGIEYRSHVQTYGWQGYVADGALSGTTGQAKRLEAVQIKLTGDLSKDYDVYYRAHVQSLGWLAWVSNGDMAGTSSYFKRVEAIEIILLEKGSDAPTSSAKYPYLNAGSGSIAYQTCVGTSSSWTGSSMGAVAGSTSGTTAVTGVSISNEGTVAGGLSYSAHLANIGWTPFSSGGTTVGKCKATNGVQGLKIQLTGDLAKYYDVYYRVYIPGYGWMGWTKNGSSAGTTGLSLNISAYQVKLIMKGNSAPGSTSKCFSDSSGFMKEWKTGLSYLDKANKYSSNTNWLILVDTVKNKVAIFYGEKGSWTLEKLWSCTDGAPSSPTVKGIFTVGSRGLSFGSGYTCWYWTQFYGNYLFHSVLYNQGSMSSVQDGRLGISASHGCVRLAIGNAKWIYDNIPYKTKVVVY